MKKIFYFLFIFLVFNINFVNASIEGISAKNIILYNVKDDNVLYEKDSNEKVQIASLTKIMTTLVAIENAANLDSDVVISSDVFKGTNGYAVCGLKVGDKVTIRDLLYGVLLPSGADCVNGVIKGVSGNSSDFVKLMNDKVKSLGLKNTKFDNAIGMDSKDNYSTASDLAVILKSALNNKTFREIYTTKKYTMKSNNLTVKSTLLGYSGGSLDVSNILGAKSGFTDGAGLCLASIARVNNIYYLLIVLGADSGNRSNAIRDSLAIYNYYGDNYDYRTVISKDTAIDKIKVKWGKNGNYVIKSNKDVKVYLKKSLDIDDLKYNYNGVKEITYKNNKGDKLGFVTVKYKGKEIYSFDVYLNDKLEFYHPVLYFIIFVCIVSMLLSLLSIRKIRRKKKRKKKKKSK